MRSIVASLLMLIFLPLPLEAAEPFVLQLKWKPQFEFAGYYIAQDLGFYAEAGVDVEIRAGGPGLDSLNEVVEGRADFGVSSSNLLAAKINGAPVKALAAIFQHSPARFVTLKESQIERAEQLAGKRVMLLPNNASFELVTLLSQLNLMDSIERLDTSFNIDSLVDGEADAFNAYVTNEPYDLQEWGVEYNLIDPADYGIEFYADVLFTSDSVANRKPEEVRAFANASLRGWQYALDNPSHAIEIVAKYAPQKRLSHLRYEALAMHEHLSRGVVPIGYMNSERWLSIKDYLASIGEVPHNAKVDLEQFIFPIAPPVFDWVEYRIHFGVAGATVLLLLGWALWAHREKLRVESELQHTFEMATHDALTGLSNRYLFTDRLVQILAQKERKQMSPLVAFIDIDKFKAINDTLGHQAGDEFLQALGVEMLSETRPADTLARIGGGEFALLVTQYGSGSEVAICERLRQAVARVVDQYELKHLQVDASIGAIIIDSYLPNDPESILALADREMYAAKCSQFEKIRVARLSTLRGALFKVA